jgi:hypothetical protein
VAPPIEHPRATAWPTKQEMHSLPEKLIIILYIARFPKHELVAFGIRLYVVASPNEYSVPYSAAR